MHFIRLAIEITKLRPGWATHSIAAIIQHDRSKVIRDDPRFTSKEAAEAIVALWESAPEQRVAWGWDKVS